MLLGNRKYLSWRYFRLLSMIRLALGNIGNAGGRNRREEMLERIGESRGISGKKVLGKVTSDKIMDKLI